MAKIAIRRILRAMPPAPSSTDTPSSRWALPSLAGWARWPFLAVWLALFGCSLWSSAMELPIVLGRIASPSTAPQRLGFMLAPAVAWPTIGTVGASAERAGLHKGDRLLLIDGHPVGLSAQDRTKQLSGPPGSVVSMVVIAPGGGVRRHVLTRDPDRFRRELAGSGLSAAFVAFGVAGIPFLLGEAIFLTAAAVLMVRRSHDPLAPWASMMMLWFLLGDTGAGSWFTSHFPHPLQVHFAVNAVAYSLVSIVLSVFPDGRFDPRWSLATAIVGTAVAIVTEPFPNDLGNILLTLSQGAAVLAIATRYRRMPPGTARQQIRWAIFGFSASVVALLLGAFCQFAESLMVHIGPDLWLRMGASFFIAATHGLLAVAITTSLLRYRLYDADVTISRSIIYATLTLVLLVTFTVSQKLIEMLGEYYLGAKLGALSGTLAAALAAAMVAPVRTRATGWAEKKFRSGLARLRLELPPLVADLRETATPERMGDAVLEHVAGGVRAQCGVLTTHRTVVSVRGIDRDAATEWLDRFATSETAPSLQSEKADPLLPIRLPLRTEGAGTVGWLLLGPRPDGSLYGREERHALQDLAEPIGRALATTLIHRDRSQAREARDAEQQEQIESLQRAIVAMGRVLEAQFGVTVDVAGLK